MLSAHRSRFPLLRASSLLAAALLVATTSGLSGCGRSPTTEIGVYSGRHYNTDKVLYQRFTERTGIRVRLLEGKDGTLIERVRSEGDRGRADLLILADAARLERAASLGLLRPSRSASLEQDVPADLRDPQGRWFALTRRVRLIVTNPGRLGGTRLRDYGDLAAPALRGQLCLRDNRSVYNQSLVADQLIRRGPAATRAWIEGMVANLAQPPFSADIPLVRAVARGDCGAALVNSYYVARLLSGDSGAEDRRLAASLQVILPDPAHVNISGAGITASSRRPEAARALLEFLASPAGGAGYAEANHEYPLRGSGRDPILRRFGPLRSDGVSAAQLGARNAEATRLMIAAGWR